MLWYGTDALDASELLGYFHYAKQQVVMYEGQECRYRSGSSEAGSSQVICGLIGLNCVRRVFELEEQLASEDLEDKDENFLQELISPETIQRVTSIDDTLKAYSNLSVEDLLERPQFQNAFTQAAVSHEHLSYEGFIALFEAFGTIEQTDRPVAAVITRLRDIIVCIRLYLRDSYRFFIFDPHRQPKHPRGPAFVLNDSKETAARYLHELLKSDDSSDGEVEEFHSNSQMFSAHILRMETSERWRLATPIDLPLSGDSLEASNASSSSFLGDDLAFVMVPDDPPPPYDSLSPIDDTLAADLVSADISPLIPSNDIPLDDLQSNDLSSNDLQPSDSFSDDLTSNDLPSNGLSSGNLSTNGSLSDELTSSSSTPVVTSEVSSIPTPRKRREYHWQLGLQMASPISPSSPSALEGPRETQLEGRPTDQPSFGQELNNTDTDTSTPLLIRKSAIGWQLALQKTALEDAPAVEREGEGETTATGGDNEWVQLEMHDNRDSVTAGPSRQFDRNSTDDGFSWKVALAAKSITVPHSGSRANDTSRSNIQNSAEEATNLENARAENETSLEASSSLLNTTKPRSLGRRTRDDFSWKLALAAQSLTTPPPQSTVTRDPVTTTRTRRAERQWRPTQEIQNHVLIGTPHRSSTHGKRRDTTNRRASRSSSLRGPVVLVGTEVNAVIAFDCGVCLETLSGDLAVKMLDCEHSYCQDCLRGHVESKLGEGRYPILCPLCTTDKARSNPGTVGQQLLEKLGLSEEIVDKFVELQLAGLSFQLSCPNCENTMFVAREDYLEQDVVICPLPYCGHKFCKACLITVAGDTNEHICTANDNGLIRLMQENGWRQCPGCRTAIQKESGCNHMHCTSPGCNVHFCYKCGLMIGTADGLNVGAALTAHYRTCQQFDTTPAAPVRLEPGPIGPQGARRGGRNGENCTIQ